MANKVNSFQVQGSKYGIEPDYIFDQTPTQGSTNPVTSNGIYEAINGVSLGSSVSYGRTEGTPIGYCSISYGTNNIAAGDYSISIGEDNSVYNPRSVACGVDNIIYGSGSGCTALGSQNEVCAYQTGVTIGWGNQVGAKINNTGSHRNINEKVYAGYFNPQTKKLYFDPEMTDEYAITLKNPNYGSTYVIDLTDASGMQRTPGDIYEYDKSYGTTSVKKILPSNAQFTDEANNFLYTYKGSCYCDFAADKCYTDSTKTQEISNPIYSHIWYDTNSGDFVAYTYGVSSAVKPGGGTWPNWVKVNVYRGIIVDPNDEHCGKHAYVDSDSLHGSTYGMPYSTADHVSGTEILNELIDGQLVVDISSGYIWRYRFDTKHNVVFAEKCSNYVGGSISSWWLVVPQGSSSLAIGHDNFTTGGTGSIVAGSGNNLTRYSESAAIFGHYNNVAIGPGINGQCATLVAGIQHSIRSVSIYSHTLVSLGQENTINVESLQGGDRIVAIGALNTVTASNGGFDIGVFGEYCNIGNCTYTKVIGYTNTVNNIGQSYVIGSFNHIGDSSNVTYTDCNIGKDGIMSGYGITYNTSTQTYSFDTTRIYKKLQYVPYEPQPVCTGYYVSRDGSTLVPYDQGAIENSAKLHVFGYYNYYYRKIDITNNNGTYNQDNTIIGSYNTLTAYDAENITIVGSGLNVNYGDNPAQKGAVFTGYSNSMTGITGAVFIVGNGDGWWDGATQSNGFVVYQNGEVAAPSAPDTIAAGITAMGTTGTNSDKMLITYAQLRDYTGPGGGGQSRPNVTIVNLLSTDWSNFEQTISVSGIKSDSIVIIQPSGSAYAFNHDDIFLKAQANGELTFGCSAGPTVDISVKVVYWA